MSQNATLAVMGACVLFLGIVLEVVGFVSPWWVSYECSIDESYRQYMDYYR